MRVFTDRRCREHRAPPGYPERPERLIGSLESLRAGAWELGADESEGDPAAARAAVETVHDPDYVSRFEAAIARGDGLIDTADNPLSSGTWPAAWGAVECALTAVDWAVAAEERAAFAAVRPPGHHAERAGAMGFCYFNTVAVAAEHLRRIHGLERIAIVDFDVHHGNGTQHIFEEHDDVLFVSVHQFPFYPGTGASAETGLGDGVGATLNLPLPAGCGDAEYLEAFDRRLLPTLKRFSPQFLLVSAGFDAWREDPIGGMRVTMDGFRSFGQRLAAAAHDLCRGRSVSVLEGGYDLKHLGELIEHYLEGLEAG